MITPDDSKFTEIKNLKWLPWIGNRFDSLTFENKMLIVGESHYHDNTPESIEKHNLSEFTRKVIEELAIGGSSCGTKIFPNLHRALFKNDLDSSISPIFWNLVSFYNFIQKPMQTNKERPSGKDFYESWSPFLDLIKLLKPKICLFIGTTAANSLKYALQDTNFSLEDIKWEEKISNAYAKTALLKDNDGNETQLIFIQHTSSRFSWEKWNNFLQKKISTELTWFEEQMKIQ